MRIETYIIDKIKIAEVISDNIIINSAVDGLDLLGNLYYQDFDKIILYEKNITPQFFDLKTGIAGEIFQKFSNYRVRLAIIGNFEKYQNKSMKDLIFESNRGKHINFVKNLSEAIESFSKQ